MDIHAIYASTSGNVEKVVETVAGILRAGGHTVTLHRAEQTPIELVTANSCFILATSTWEHGVINPFFKPLLEALKSTNCQGKRAAFIGLGDRRYEPVLFTEGMSILRNTWLQQGGQEIGEPLRMQGEPYAQIEYVVKPWTTSIMEALSTTNDTHA